MVPFSQKTIISKKLSKLHDEQLYLLQAGFAPAVAVYNNVEDLGAIPMR